jgi:hypothetical protein
MDGCGYLQQRISNARRFSSASPLIAAAWTSELENEVRQLRVFCS